MAVMDFRTRLTLQRSGLPKRYWMRHIEPDPAVHSWMDHLDQVLYDLSSDLFGQGLVLCGPEATTNAAWLFTQFLERGSDGGFNSCLFVDWASFLDEARERDGRVAAVDDILHPSLLVLDQLDLVRPEWITSLLMRVVKTRYDEGRPTILTTSKREETARHSLANCLDFAPNCMRFVETLGSEG